MRLPTKSEAAAAVAAATLIATPFVAKWEGRSLVPYLDIAKVPTVCDGETRVEMRAYTNTECDLMLQKALSQDYAPAVLRAVPAIREHPRAFAASIVLSYNIGNANFASSTAARRFNAGDWKGGCDAFLRFNGIVEKHPAKGALSSHRMGDGRYFNVYRGLNNRREDERRLCLS